MRKLLTAIVKTAVNIIGLVTGLLIAKLIIAFTPEEVKYMILGGLLIAIVWINYPDSE